MHQSASDTSRAEHDDCKYRKSQTIGPIFRSYRPFSGPLGEYRQQQTQTWLEHYSYRSNERESDRNKWKELIIAHAHEMETCAKAIGAVALNKKRAT